MQRKLLLIFEEVNEHNLRETIEIYEEFQSYWVKLNKNYYCIAKWDWMCNKEDK